MNRILQADSYKLSHYKQYPEGTTKVFSYAESRGSEREYTKTVFFGLQMFLKKYFSTPITLDEVEEAKVISELHGVPFNYEGWKLLIDRHNGFLPLRIRAVPEGLVVPNYNVLMTVENTDPDFAWLTSYFETVLLRAIWYPTTVATQSYYLKGLIHAFLVQTADDPDAEIDFKLHDFGARGVSSEESAQIGGLAHLVNFKGTDTLSAIMAGRKFYHEPMAGFSIPAAEHSTITSWGQDHEVDAYRNMLKQYAKPNSLVAVVSDSWNIFNACEKLWGEQLKQEVIDSGATVVIRPDSGDPVTVVNKVITILAEKFGTTVNTKGYKVLNNVRIIQGDGINPTSILNILSNLKTLGFSATNIAFGMGGALLQKVDRDTLKFAFKCSAMEINGKVREVYKNPVTDAGKASKKGILDLIKERGEYKTVDLRYNLAPAYPYAGKSAMKTYFENGQILVDYTLEQIRKRAWK